MSLNDLALEARWIRSPEICERIVEQTYRIGLLVARRMFPSLLAEHYQDTLDTVTGVVWEAVERYDPDQGDFINLYYKYALTALRNLMKLNNPTWDYDEPRPRVTSLDAMVIKGDKEDLPLQITEDNRPVAQVKRCLICDQTSEDGFCHGLCQNCRRRRQKAAKATGTIGACLVCHVLYVPIYGDAWGQRVTAWRCPSCGVDPVLEGARRDEQ